MIKVVINSPCFVCVENPTEFYLDVFVSTVGYTVYFTNTLGTAFVLSELLLVLWAYLFTNAFHLQLVLFCPLILVLIPVSLTRWLVAYIIAISFYLFFLGLILEDSHSSIFFAPVRPLIQESLPHLAPGSHIVKGREMRTGTRSPPLVPGDSRSKKYKGRDRNK